jgi:hypothetical protein
MIPWCGLWIPTPLALRELRSWVSVNPVDRRQLYLPISSLAICPDGPVLILLIDLGGAGGQCWHHALMHCLYLAHTRTLVVQRLCHHSSTKCGIGWSFCGPVLSQQGEPAPKTSPYNVSVRIRGLITSNYMNKLLQTRDKPHHNE